MKNYSRWIRFVSVLAGMVLFAAACAPGDIELLTPVPGQEQPGALEPGSSGEVGSNLNLPPTEPICPTPTPLMIQGTAVSGEEGVFEGVAGPATTLEPVSGDLTVGTPDSDLLDQVNKGPEIGPGEPPVSDTGAEPSPGSESQVGDLDDSGQGTASTFGELVNSVIGQVLGTTEPGGVSFEPPPPSPTPCP